MKTELASGVEHRHSEKSALYAFSKTYRWPVSGTMKWNSLCRLRSGGRGATNPPLPTSKVGILFPMRCVTNVISKSLRWFEFALKQTILAPATFRGRLAPGMRAVTSFVRLVPKYRHRHNLQCRLKQKGRCDGDRTKHWMILCYSPDL